jgi:hypothetical protein
LALSLISASSAKLAVEIATDRTAAAAPKRSDVLNMAAFPRAGYEGPAVHFAACKSSTKKKFKLPVFSANSSDEERISPMLA